ncbi:ATP-binding protein [Aureibacillus halotolerans]|uniref:ATP-binding protein n=1 Tax=Aureibacillus halotolerans TaxID=1508390 RepID=UPI00106010B0
MVDPIAVKQVLDNLLVNTLKYARSYASIQFQVTPDHAVFSISKDVEHLTEKDVPFLFNRLYTTDKARTDRGLAIAKNEWSTVS